MAPISRLLVLQILAVVTSAFPGVVITRDGSSSLRAEYDYIVAGGGTSGLVVANRLSEDQRTTVLVIEAGPIVNGRQEFEQLLGGTPPQNFGVPNNAYQWNNVSSEPIEGLNNRVVPVVSARVVGGGSAINGKIFGRGSKRDFDDWGRYLNDPSWKWDNFINYYKKAETFTPPDEEYRAKGNVTWDMAVHGKSGPISSTFPKYFFESAKYLLAAEKGMGIPQKKEQASGDLVGGVWVPISNRAREQDRSYSKREYYDPMKERPNLHLITGHAVSKILFRGKTAVGVEYNQGPGKPNKTVKVKKEVIVAAGGHRSPQLLQLSGLGDKKLLQRLRIPVIADLPNIGENFHDHGFLVLGYNLTSPQEEVWWNQRNMTYIQEQYKLFIEKQTGRYTATFNDRMMLLSVPILLPQTYQSVLAKYTREPPQKYLRAGIGSAFVEEYKKQHDLLIKTFATNESASDENIGGAMCGVLKPLSRGYIHAQSTSIWDQPKINYRTYSHPLDLELEIAAVRFARKFMARPELAPLNPVETSPGLHVQSDEDLTAFIRQNTKPDTGHPCCTAAMGTVLDSRMRVKGVNGVRVVDAASWPFIPGAHATQCTAYAVAEKAADLIKTT